jgi:hypothetical protein
MKKFKDYIKKNSPKIDKNLIKTAFRHIWIKMLIDIFTIFID